MPSQLPALFRPRDLERFGISRDRLRGMLRRGEVEPVSRGLYRVTSEPFSRHETLAAVCARVPHAIVCLLSALSFHVIGTEIPRHVWIAIDRKARLPKLDLPVRIVRFSEMQRRYAVETHEVEGVTVRVTSPARTVVDCFRFMDRVGLDVALGALKDGLRSQRFSVDELSRAAEVVGVTNVLRPYLEALFA